MRVLLTTTLLAACAMVANAQAFAASGRNFEGPAKDAWITGKVETIYALNRHLNPFSIDTDVENGVVYLRGTVESDVDRDLAEELAEGVEGVAAVENELTVDMHGARSTTSESAQSRRDFGTWVDDATTTAAVKAQLIGNENTEGIKIDVDTDHDIVTLSGRVDSDAEKDLAGQIALNTQDVEAVRNNLVVDPS